MAERASIDFTERERFILGFYRSPELAFVHRRWLYDGAIMAASLACVVLMLLHHDMAFGFIAYALVVGRLYYLLVEGRQWSRDFRNIFAKYDAKVKELSQSLQGKEGRPT